MAMARWDPIEDLTQLRDLMNQVVDERIGMPIRSLVLSSARTFPLDIIDQDTAYQIRAAIPGVAPEEVDITATANTVTVHATSKAEHTEEQKGRYLRQERMYGEMTRTVTLPREIDPEQVTSTYEQGVLTIHLPKTTAAKARQIPVQVKAPATAAQDGH
jgi:HSP20 family protein